MGRLPEKTLDQLEQAIAEQKAEAEAIRQSMQPQPSPNGNQANMGALDWMAAGLPDDVDERLRNERKFNKATIDFFTRQKERVIKETQQYKRSRV